MSCFSNFNYGNYGCSGMNYGYSDGYSYGGNCGYNSYGGNPFSSFSAGPSRINMNFANGSMFMGGGYGYNMGGCFGMGMGMGMPPITGRAAESINKIRFGASGLEQIINGVDYLKYALQPRQYGGYNQGGWC